MTTSTTPGRPAETVKGADADAEVERWALELAPVAGWPGPADVRLRKLVKLALRSFGLRVTSCRRGQP